MKKFLKMLGLLLIAILALVTTWGFMNTHDDIPLEVLKEKYSYPDSRFMEVQGMDVHYRIVGNGESPLDVLVLIHGTGASLHTWEGWIEELKDDFKIIVLDMPAFGLTGPHPERDYSAAAYVSFLDAFVEKIGLAFFHIGGNSLGGRIAWEYTLKHSKKVGKMILLDASGYPQDKPAPLGFRIAQNPTLAKWLLKVTPRSLHRKSLEEVYVNDALVTDELVDRYFELMLRPGNRQAFVDRVNTKQESAEGRMHQFLNATQIMWGDQDEWVNPADAKRYDEEIINSEMIIFENTGHIPMEEKPKETAAAAREFLKGTGVFIGDTEASFQEIMAKNALVK